MSEEKDFRGMNIPRTEPKSILQQANDAVMSRQKERGSGVRVAESWARIFEALTGFAVEPEDYAWAGLAMKLARESTNRGENLDNLVDIVGYVEVLNRIRREV